MVVEQVYNTSTETSSWSFRRPQAHDIHTVVAYYTLRIYDEYGALIYTIQLSQREVYLDDALLPPGSYSVSLTATDLV
ncbi:MAG: hypothetical protein H6766_03055 [Candidatus Peribacteria bacterium]|nr:MAG: hypothetical protein H6766_03055 [Candidatus Peribacteria bacterium]